MATGRYIRLSKIKTVSLRLFLETCIIVPNFIKIGQKAAEIWRFNGFQNDDRPPSLIFEIQIF